MDAITLRKSGKAEMAYVGDTPWHGLGQQLQVGLSIEEWQQAAGMEWAIKRARVRYGEGDKARIIEDQHVLFRSDTKDPLGIVSDRFKIVQPREVLEFFRDLTQRAGFELETAGTLFGGKRFWALARIGAECEIVPGDKVGGYLLLCTGADGSLATTGKYTLIRVVCQNTISMALNSGTEYKVRHSTTFDPFKMKLQLGLAHEAFDTFAGNLMRLSGKRVSMDRAERLTFELLKPATFDTAPGEDKVGIIEKVTDSKGFKEIMALFDGGGKGSTIAGVEGTAWGWLNAVTEQTDWHSRAQSVDNRMNSAWLGAGDALKSKALDLALTF
jgi:phage/plasmid-like protein (TIGR03299 family)